MSFMSFASLSSDEEFISDYLVASSILTWMPSYAPTSPGDPWSNVGVAYLTWHSYLTACCTLCMTLISTSCSRIEIINTKVSELALISDPFFNT